MEGGELFQSVGEFEADTLALLYSGSDDNEVVLVGFKGLEINLKLPKPSLLSADDQKYFGLKRLHGGKEDIEAKVVVDVIKVVLLDFKVETFVD